MALYRQSTTPVNVLFCLDDDFLWLSLRVEEKAMIKPYAEQITEAELEPRMVLLVQKSSRAWLFIDKMQHLSITCYALRLIYCDCLQMLQESP